MRVGFYGKLRDSFGEECDVPAVAGETVAGLRSRLAGLRPAAAAHLRGPGTRACVDDEIVGEDFVIDGRGRVEFLPPLSGG